MAIGNVATLPSPEVMRPRPAFSTSSTSWAGVQKMFAAQGREVRQGRRHRRQGRVGAAEQRADAVVDREVLAGLRQTGRERVDVNQGALELRLVLGEHAACLLGGSLAVFFVEQRQQALRNHVAENHPPRSRSGASC